MIYPLISEYIEAIKSPEDNFDKLSHLRPVLDDNGNPIMSSGNFAVVFKMTDGEKDYAIKCFTREQDGRVDAYKKIVKYLDNITSPYITKIDYLEDELFVDSAQSDESEFPIVIMDWIEGCSLEAYINRYSGNPFELHDLCYNFGLLAKWLISQDFAHGDIKPDNIIVKDDGNLVLIDYDGMFIPGMSEEQPREQGSPNYRHPYRRPKFNKSIDDFSLSIISLSLKMISVKYDIRNEFKANDSLLFTSKDLLNLNNSNLFNLVLTSMVEDETIGLYYATFIKAYGGNILSDVDFGFKEEQNSEGILKFWDETVVAFTDSMIKVGILEDNGVIYSKDGRRVIGFAKEEYNDEIINVREGTIAICDGAFQWCLDKKVHLHLPKSMRFFSSKSFDYHYSNISWDSPWFTYVDGYILTKDRTECVLKHLVSAKFNEDVLIIGHALFSGLDFDGIWPTNLIKIRSYAFADSKVPPVLHIPNSVYSIGHKAFRCSSIQEITLPTSLSELGSWCFHLCDKLGKVYFAHPSPITKIKENTFCNCKNLREISFPSRIREIGKSAFLWCISLQNIYLPKNLEHIGCEAFRMDSDFSNDHGSSKLEHVDFPKSLKEIGNFSFSGCYSLKQLKFTSSINRVGKGAFKNCYSLNEIEYVHIDNVEELAFRGCDELEFTINDELENIEEGALTGVKNIINKSNLYILDGETLYSSGYKKLIYYWGHEDSLKVKDGVKKLCKLSFLNIPTTIVLPATFDESELRSACFCDVLVVPEHFDIHEANIHNTIIRKQNIFKDSSGVIYSEDMTELISFPMSLKIESYTVNPKCITIKKNAFEYDYDYDAEFHCGYSYGNKLKALSLPNGLINIEDYALQGCIELEKLTLPDSIEIIGCNALPEKLKNINIPRNLTLLSKTSIPSSVVKIIGGSTIYKVGTDCIINIEGDIFWVSPDITTLSITNDINRISKGDIPKNVKCLKFLNPNLIIEEGAIPYTVAEIRGSLNSYIVNSNYLASTKGVLLWVKPDVEDFDIPGDIIRIGNDAFMHRDNLSSIKIGGNVRTIGSSAFHYCYNIKEIIINVDLDDISQGALKSSKICRGSHKYWYIDHEYPNKVYLPRLFKKKLLKLLGDIDYDKIVLLDN